MNLEIPLSPAAKIALEREASARNKSVEQTAGEVIEAFFTRHGAHETGYDAWFKAKVEEGLEEARQGRFASGAEVERRAKARRERLLRQMSNEQ